MGLMGPVVADEAEDGRGGVNSAILSLGLQ